MIRGKRGQELEVIADITLSVLMLIGTYFIVKSLIITSFAGEQTVFRQAVVQINNDEVFVQYLNSEHRGKRMSDIIAYSYLNGQEDYLKANMDDFLNSIYPRKVCYMLRVDESLEIDVPCKEEEDYPLLDSDITIPIMDNPETGSVNVSLIIGGYSE
jgi:hypothetical protein